MKKHLVYLKKMIIVLLVAFIVAFFMGWLPVTPIAIATGSMEPAIRVGDVVVVCRTDPEILEVGDIIQYQKDNYTVVHRIVEIQDDENGISGFITKGDYNNAPDADMVKSDQIEGRVLFVIPAIGLPTLWLHGMLSGI